MVRPCSTENALNFAANPSFTFNKATMTPASAPPATKPVAKRDPFPKSSSSVDLFKELLLQAKKLKAIKHVIK